MPMNVMHRRICSSRKWADGVRDRMPAFLDRTPLGDDVLEIGPGFGATTRAMVDHVPSLTCVEIDPASVRRLRAEFSPRVDVVLGDGAALPFPDGRFSAVVCFTMLHHVPSAQQQDALFAEAARVLRPGGVFAGLDSQPSLRFRFLHIGDTMVVLDPATLPGRLERAGLVGAAVTRAPGRVLFSARRPG
jgi:SAM-dependent methyltransferase